MTFKLKQLLRNNYPKTSRHATEAYIEVIKCNVCRTNLSFCSIILSSINTDVNTKSTTSRVCLYVCVCMSAFDVAIPEPVLSNLLSGDVSVYLSI